jgi:actin-like ATPase involved in cell morphogenesis
MVSDIDDVLFTGKRIAFESEENNMATAKKTTRKYVSNCAGLDVGTGWLVGSSFLSKTKMDYTPLRDCFYTIPEDMFSKSMFNKEKVKYVEHNDQIHIVGEDALTLAKIQNGSAQRPMAKGVINPNERSSAPILREMIRYCIEANPLKKGSKVVFSVPATMVDSDQTFNVEYHELSISSLISSLGYEPEPLNEAFAVIISELQKADEVTGLGLSFGAGLVNVAMAYKGMKLFEFSINKSGDFIDQESSNACGVSESMMNHIKEKQLDLTKNEFEVDAEERALIFTHKHVIKNAIQNIVKALNKADSVNIIEPVPVIISGGTTLPNGFAELFEQELRATKLPFEVTEVIPAQDRLTAVARGCLMWANRG